MAYAGNVPSRKRGRGPVIALAVLCVLLVALAAAAFIVVGGSTPATAPRESSSAIAVTADAGMTAQEQADSYARAHKGRPEVHPLIAQCAGIDLRSPIAPADLTGVLFHQASYSYAQVMSTALPDANMEQLEATHTPRVNRDQFEGAWLDADAMHLWRVADATEMDTSIDVGAAAGTMLKSPVDGTVVLVKDYLLYDEVPDIEIHIQPPGRPDLDVVLIHTADPLVKAGDAVKAGQTDISHVRDIAKDLDDVQLAFYTPSEDPGNHTHVQVNDANYEGYRATKLEGAIPAP